MTDLNRKQQRAFRSRHSLAHQTYDALDTLAAFSQILEVVDLDAVMEFVVRRTRAIFESDAAAILLLDAEGFMLAPQATTGLSDAYATQRVAFNPDIMRGDRTYVVADLTVESEGNNALAAAEGLRSALTAPLCANGSYIGLLNVYTRTPHSFSQHDHMLLAALARCAAQAIANARRHQSDQLIKNDLEQAYSELFTTLTELERAQQRLMRTERLRALGELASSVAHDFNNLLTGILGNAQILLADVSEPQRQLLEVIEQAALDGRALVRRIQEYTRQPATTPSPTLIDLTGVIDGALAITRPRWLARARTGVEITVRREVRGTLLVLGSAPELREVLINLIINAIDAMPNGGTLLVRGLNPVESAAAVVLEVVDSGVGIAPALLPDIFEPFFTTKRADEGSGLGLAICKSIVEHHGGTISVESALGEGACFRITLPEAGDEA